MFDQTLLCFGRRTCTKVPTGLTANLHNVKEALVWLSCRKRYSSYAFETVTASYCVLQCALHLYVSCNYDIICFLNLQLIVIFIGTTAANQVMQAVLPFIVLGVNIAKERSKYRSALKTTTKYLEESNDSLDDQDRLDELSASGGRLGAFATAKTEVDKYELEVRNCLGIKKHTFAWCHFKSC